jgi:hypothetical protein
LSNNQFVGRTGEAINNSNYLSASASPSSPSTEAAAGYQSLVSSPSASIPAIHLRRESSSPLILSPKGQQQRANSAQQKAASSSGSSSRKKKKRLFPLLQLRSVVKNIETFRDAASYDVNPFKTFISRRVVATDRGSSSHFTQLEALVLFQPETARNSSAKAFLIDRVGRKSSRPFSSVSYNMNIEDDDDASASSEKWERKKNMFINLSSIFLYTVNYYIIVPTANSYAELLGADASMAGLLVGASNITAILGALMYSFWCIYGTYRSALMFSAGMPLIGNLLYAYAITPQSFNLAYLGRLFIGFGCAEVCNRNFIIISTPVGELTAACALFVAAGAIGMSVGPMVAALLDMFVGRDTEVDITYIGVILNHVTSPGFVMAAAWLLQLLAIIYVFKEPCNTKKKIEDDKAEEELKLLQAGRDREYRNGEGKK